MAKQGAVRKEAVEMQAEEARRSFKDCLERVGFRGERIVVKRFGQKIAAIVSIADLAKLEGAAR